MRFILANLIHDESVTFDNIHDIIPEIYSFDDFTHAQFTQPRILKSHECFTTYYPKVIYIVRDPQAVVISYYYYHLKHKKITNSYSMSRFVKKFIRGKLDDFGSWADNVSGWLEARNMDEDKVVLIRYEDMIDDIMAEVIKTVNFLAWKKSENQIRSAIELSSFEKMRESEQIFANKNKFLKNSLKGVNFMRSGKKFEWKEKLDLESQNRIKEEWGHLMIKLGYLE